MRVLLINSNRFKQPWPVMPFGLCCVAASLEKSGCEVDFLDLCFSRNCARDIHNAVTDFKPNMVGVGIRNIDNSAGFKPEGICVNCRFIANRSIDDIHTHEISGSGS